MSISVIILNFNRPEYIKYNIIPALNKINLIDEIIISHGREETFFTTNCSKVKHLKHWGKYNQMYGLALRFISAQEAKNNDIIIMDDDIIPPEKTILTLHDMYKKDKERIYGIYGRYLDEKNEYVIDNVFGEVPIVLTRFLLTHKEFCTYFLENFRLIENSLIKESKPYWNGEDILFSLLSIKKYGKLPKAVDLKHHNRIANYFNMTEAISTGASEHLIYRKKLSSYLLKTLNLVNIINENTKISKRKNQINYFFFNSVLFYIFLFLFIPLTILYFKKYYFQ